MTWTLSENVKKLPRAKNVAVGQGQQLIMPHQQMIPVQINHQQLNYQVQIENNVRIIFISSSFINVLTVY